MFDGSKKVPQDQSFYETHYDVRILMERTNCTTYYVLIKSRSVWGKALYRLGHCQSRYASTFISTIALKGMAELSLMSLFTFFARSHNYLTAQSTVRVTLTKVQFILERPLSKIYIYFPLYRVRQ